MKLNPDCTRDLMLYFEDKTGPNYILSFSPDELGDDFKPLAKYSVKELEYHISQCSEAGLLIGCKSDLSGNIMVRDVSPKGHEFLGNIRSDTVWNSTKSVACKIGATSLNALCQIATGVVTEIIKAQLGL